MLRLQTWAIKKLMAWLARRRRMRHRIPRPVENLAVESARRCQSFWVGVRLLSAHAVGSPEFRDGTQNLADCLGGLAANCLRLLICRALALAWKIPQALALWLAGSALLHRKIIPFIGSSLRRLSRLGANSKSSAANKSWSR